MILTGFLKQKNKKQTLKMNLNLKQMKRVSEIKLFDTFYACAGALRI